jgi:hypothetical protein
MWRRKNTNRWEELHYFIAPKVALYEIADKILF